MIPPDERTINSCPVAMKFPQNLCVAFLLLKTCFLLSVASDEDQRLVNAPGHLKPFGFSEKYMTIDEIDGFLLPNEFMQKYVLKSKPLLMKNAAKKSKAFTAWTDDYFLNDVEEPEDSKVTIEARKKEDRNAPATDMKFKDFVRIYNTTDQYMVNTVPSFLARDVAVPGPLQCDGLMDSIIDVVMWFSSGGTKSVVHTDSVDNINCLFRGEKTLIMVDPHEYGNKVDLDRPEGSYSAMDVDSVDFTKYPGMADVQFYKVQMSPGDCLYIPFEWIHQVRSTGSNLAVNAWWDHDKGTGAELDHCPKRFNYGVTLDLLNISGFMSADTAESTLEDLLDNTVEGSLDFMHLLNISGIAEVRGKSESEMANLQAPLKKMFDILDLDQNGEVSSEEIEGISEDAKRAVGKHSVQFNMLANELQDQVPRYEEYREDNLDSVDREEL